MVITLYLIIGMILGYWGINKLYPYFDDYPLTFIAAIIWGFFCVGFIPTWLCCITFKVY